MTIPTYRDASDRRCEGQATAMDHFIFEWQPEHDECDDFRADLQTAVDEFTTETHWMLARLFIATVVSVILNAAMILYQTWG